MDDPFAILRALSLQIAEDLLESSKKACTIKPHNIKNVLPANTISLIVYKLANDQGKYVKFKEVPMAFTLLNALPGFLQKNRVDAVLDAGIRTGVLTGLMDTICGPLVLYVAKFTSEGTTYLIDEQYDPTVRKVLNADGTKILGNLSDEKFKALFHEVKEAETAAKLPAIEVTVPIASLPDHEINDIMLARLTAMAQSMITFYVDNDFDYLNRTFELKGKSAGGRKQKSRRGHKQKSRRGHKQKSRRGHKTRRHKRRFTRKH